MSISERIDRLVQQHRKGLITDMELGEEVQRAHLEGCTGCIECLDRR